MLLQKSAGNSIFISGLRRPAGPGQHVVPLHSGLSVFQTFFLTRRWFLWAIPGGALILFATWYKVQLDVQINDWFGSFYNLIQKALSTPGAITMQEYFRQLATFGWIAGLYVLIGVLTDFFVKHYVFRWRTRDDRVLHGALADRAWHRRRLTTRSGRHGPARRTPICGSHRCSAQCWVRP